MARLITSFLTHRSGCSTLTWNFTRGLNGTHGAMFVLNIGFTPAAGQLKLISADSIGEGGMCRCSCHQPTACLLSVQQRVCHCNRETSLPPPSRVLLLQPCGTRHDEGLNDTHSTLPTVTNEEQIRSFCDDAPQATTQVVIRRTSRRTRPLPSCRSATRRLSSQSLNGSRKIPHWDVLARALVGLGSAVDPAFDPPAGAAEYPGAAAVARAAQPDGGLLLHQHPHCGQPAAHLPGEAPLPGSQT